MITVAVRSCIAQEAADQQEAVQFGAIVAANDDAGCVPDNITHDGAPRLAHRGICCCAPTLTNDGTRATRVAKEGKI